MDREEVLIQALRSAEASRRVAWAKYYEATSGSPHSQSDRVAVREKPDRLNVDIDEGRVGITILDDYVCVSFGGNRVAILREAGYLVGTIELVEHDENGALTGSDAVTVSTEPGGLVIAPRRYDYRPSGTRNATP